MTWCEWLGGNVTSHFHDGEELDFSEPFAFVVATVADPAKRKPNPNNFRNGFEEMLNSMDIEGKNPNR